MTSETVSRDIENLLDQLLDLEAEARSDAINDLRNNDPALAERLRRLLLFTEDKTSIPSELNIAAPKLLEALAKEDQDARIGERLGAYEITAFMSRGGMGSVYKGKRIDGVFEQIVAIKFLPAHWANKARRELFERERQYLADLEHPNIARIIDAGVADDTSPYFIMEFIEGKTLDEALRKLSLSTALQHFSELCSAVSFCHRSFVVHGDLKPSNILISDGRVRLLDFGIGRFLETRENASASSLLGYSKKYAAPEQISGASASIRTDIYSLGILMKALLPQISTNHELTAIADKASADSPIDRYETVDALVADIEAFSSGKPVAAIPQSRIYMSVKFLSRNRLAVASLVAIFLSLAAGLGMTTWQSRVATQQAARAEAVSTFLKAMFDRIDPEAAGVEAVTLRQIMDESAERLTTDLRDAPEIQNEVRGIIASGYLGLGEFQLALQMREEALAYLNSQLKPPDEKLVDAQNALAGAYHSFGRFEEAADLCQNSADQLTSLGFIETEMAAETFTCIANNISQAQGKEAAAKSIALKKQALAIYEHLYPENDPAIAKSLSSLGEAMRNADDYAAAARYREKAFEIAKLNDLQSVPSFMRTLCNLALDYVALGRHEDALATNQSCLSLKRDRLGDNHAEIATSLNNIARLNFQLGEVKKGMSAVDTGLKIAEESFPETNLTRLALEINKAAGLQQSGLPDEAHQTISAVVIRMSERLGSTHSATNRARTIQARILLDLDATDEAGRLMSASMVGLSPSWEADALLWRAEIALRKGEGAKAARLAEGAVKLRKSLPIFTHWQIAEAEFIEALAADDEADARKAAQIVLAELSPEHTRYKAAEKYLKSKQQRK